MGNKTITSKSTLIACYFINRLSVNKVPAPAQVPIAASSSPVPRPSTVFHGFASHSHGIGGANHATVMGIVGVLRKRGLDVWVDEDHARGELSTSILEGLRQSKCFILFLTRDYADKVNAEEDEDDNWCSFEFDYAKQHMINKIVIVNLDTAMRNSAGWEGELQPLRSVFYRDLSGLVPGSKEYRKVINNIVKDVLVFNK